MTVLGNLVLWLAFLVGVWGALAGLVGGLRARPDLQQSARHAVFVMCGALLVAVFSLEVALFRHDFNVEYVAAYTSRNLPIFYTWSALYAGQKGSLLFWATRSEEHTSELQSHSDLVCRLLLEKKKNQNKKQQ